MCNWSGVDLNNSHSRAASLIGEPRIARELVQEALVASRLVDNARKEPIEQRDHLDSRSAGQHVHRTR